MPTLWCWNEKPNLHASQSFYLLPNHLAFHLPSPMESISFPLCLFSPLLGPASPPLFQPFLQSPSLVQAHISVHTFSIWILVSWHWQNSLKSRLVCAYSSGSTIWIPHLPSSPPAWWLFVCHIVRAHTCVRVCANQYGCVMASTDKFIWCRFALVRAHMWVYVRCACVCVRPLLAYARRPRNPALVRAYTTTTT